MLRPYLPVCGALLAVVALGCEPSQPRARRAPGPTTATHPTPAGDAESCDAYAEAVCQHAGPESATCADARKATKLMSNSACAAAVADIDEVKEKIDKLGEVCAGLWDRLCGEIGEDTDTCKMIRSTADRFQPGDCEQMLANYDQVATEVKAMEARNKPIEGELLARMHAADAPAFGPADAKVTIVEFSDFECPYCSMAAATVNQIKSKYADRVRVVFRQFPLSFHPNAHLASQAALAAHAQGKFWEFHDKLFENQRALSRADLEGYAKALGLDLTEFNRALDEGTYKAQVDGDLALGGEVFVQGTPTMFLNGKRVDNATDFDSVATLIDAALASAAP